jgi:hypothetical protein
MNDDWLSDALHTQITRNEPPVSLTASHAIAVGRRQRRQQTALGICAGGAFIALAIVGGLALRPAGGPPVASPGSCAATVPTRAPLPAPTGFEFPSGESLPGPLPTNQATAPPIGITPSGSPTASGQTGAQAVLADRVTCYLAQAVPELLPRATFTGMSATSLGGQDLRSPLVAGPDWIIGNASLAATAVVHDDEGAGSVHVVIGPTTARPDPQRCADTSVCTLRTGPHGEVIEVHQTIGPITRHGFVDVPAGVIGYTVYVYTGHTMVLAGTHNTTDTAGRLPVSRPRPPLSIDQLITLATAPELAIFG